jgi:hypothetical protein
MSTNPNRRNLLLVAVPAGAAAMSAGSAIAALTVCTPPGATSVPADPIFAALERARRMEEACDEAAAAQQHWDDDIDAEASEALAARAALARVVPTTWVGFAALISFVAERTAFYEDYYFQNPDEMVDYSRSLDQAIKRLNGKVPS